MAESDRARYEAIFVAAYERVLAYTLRRTSDPDHAEDATAETFVVAWRRLGEIPDDPLPWLYGVARRVLANERRTGQRRRALVSRLTLELRASLPLAPDPGELAEEAALMRDALERMTDEDKEILMLVSWEQLDNRRAAEVLGMSPEVFAVRLTRARRRLLSELEKIEGRPRDPETLGIEGGELA